MANMSTPPQPPPDLYERLTPKTKKKRTSARSAEGGRANFELKKLLPLPDDWKKKSEQTLEERLLRRTLKLTDTPGSGGACASGSASGKVSCKVEKKRKRSAGKVVIPRAEHKYELYEPLAALWTQYADGISNGATERTIGDRVLRMDLHGAQLEVVRSKDPGLVGKKGILVAETANTVLVVMREDRVVTIPKGVAVIRMVVGSHTVELMLPALAYRASERSARKLKKVKDSLLI